MYKKATASLATLNNVRPTGRPFDTSESKGAIGLWVPVQVECTSLRGPRKAHHASFMASTSVNWDYAPALNAIAPGWTLDKAVFESGLKQLKMGRTFFFSVVRYDQKEGTVHSAIINPDWKPRTMEQIMAECTPQRRTLGMGRKPIVTII